MFDAIQHIVYINLDERTDRRVHVEKQLVRAFPLERIQRFSAIRAAKGAIGCSRSHIAVLELAKANGWPNVLVVEDDFTWNNFEKGSPISPCFSHVVNTNTCAFLSRLATRAPYRVVKTC
jgi:GR25 family glycosyltransferase involved in LPS biosynthesis